MTRALAALLLVPPLLAGGRAQASPFPARTGESGLLDVPDAEVVGRGGGLLSAELRFDHAAGYPNDVGPLPIVAVGGLGRRLELGFTMRESGQPGDPRPARVLFGAAAKLQLLAPGEVLPGLAVDATLDRFNEEAVAGARLLVSTRRRFGLRLATFLGAETAPGETGDLGLTYGGAVAIDAPWRTELVLEALGGPRGPNVGAAARWSVRPNVGLSLGANWFPDEDGFRVSLGFATGNGTRPRPAAVAPPPEPPAAPLPPAPPPFADDRPRFRLRLGVRSPDPSDRRIPYPAVAAARAAAPAAAPAPPEDPALARLRDREASLDLRAKALADAAAALAAREALAREAAARLEARRTGLAAREADLARRERAARARGPVPAAERALAAREAELRAEERRRAGDARAAGTAAGAAERKEREAARRAGAHAAERDRLAGLASRARTPKEALGARERALDARDRQLRAEERRIAAGGERVDAMERRVRAREAELQAFERRLDARAERIGLREARAGEQRAAAEARRRAAAPSPGASPPAPAAAAAGAAVVAAPSPVPSPPRGGGEGGVETPAPAEADERGSTAVFAMVVKSPRSIRPETVPPGAGARPAVAVERSVATAAVVTFDGPSARLSDRDREAVEGVAALASAQGLDVVVWARAGHPDRTDEAARRAEEVHAVVLRAGKLPPGRASIRVTTRPGVEEVEVVVSAVRSSRSDEEPPGPAAGEAPAPAADAPPRLARGDRGRRQIRDAVEAVRPALEACLAPLAASRSGRRTEGVLALTVDRAGQVKAVRAAGDLAGAEVEACLREAAAAWTFPAGDGPYSVDVPVTLERGGTRR